MFWLLVTIGTIVNDSSFADMSDICVTLGCLLILLALAVNSYLMMTSCSSTLTASILAMNGLAGLISSLVYYLLSSLEYLTTNQDARLMI